MNSWLFTTREHWVVGKSGRVMRTVFHHRPERNRQVICYWMSDDQILADNVDYVRLSYPWNDEKMSEMRWRWCIILLVILIGLRYKIIVLWEGPTFRRPFSPFYPRAADKRSHLPKSPRHPTKAVWRLSGNHTSEPLSSRALSAAGGVATRPLWRIHRYSVGRSWMEKV